MPIEDIRRNVPDETGALPPCQSYISIDNPMCGESANWQVLIKNQVANAMVDLCDFHKEEHERKLEALRRRQATARRTRQKRALQSDK